MQVCILLNMIAFYVFVEGMGNECSLLSYIQRIHMPVIWKQFQQ